MGWCPAGETSIMARRRKPRTTPEAVSDQIPSSSGPRCAIAAHISRTSPSAGLPLFAPDQQPVSPHMDYRYWPEADTSILNFRFGGLGRRYALILGETLNKSYFLPLFANV